MDELERRALDYHSRDGVPGKVSVVPTKPCRTADDLSLAYTPGVAKPVLKIAENPKCEPETAGKLLKRVNNIYHKIEVYPHCTIITFKGEERYTHREIEEEEEQLETTTQAIQMTSDSRKYNIQ